MGAIPLTEFESYCCLFVSDPEQRHWLFARIEALDVAYLNWHREKEESKKQQPLTSTREANGSRN